MGDRLFTFDGDVTVNASEPKTIVKPSYTVFTAENSVSDANHPFLTLQDPEEALSGHPKGVFLNPLRGTAFEENENGKGTEHAIVTIDRRFVSLIRWLGENHISVQLVGHQTDKKKVYGVYQIRALSPDQQSIMEDRDQFLQLVIKRLLNSAPPERQATAVTTGSEERRITDLPEMLNYLQCAGETLPENIRRWTGRQIGTIRTNTVSPEERRHAERALSMVLNVQWKGDYFPSVDPVRARKILDEELYGLDRVKQRIIETIIQINRTHTLPAYGLLLAGPAGIGKSMLAYSVARILGLPWTSLDMSAIHDPEALTGTPRMYANAKAGRIMEAFADSGQSNIVFIINELDKADHAGGNGNPADALLTLLDNLGYTDNYIECTIPTSGVYPVATANDKSKISSPLMSRFAVIDIPDYTPEEKKYIFTAFSLPKVLRRLHMDRSEIEVTGEAVDAIIDRFRSETGCRGLEQAAEQLSAHALYEIEVGHKKSVRYERANTMELLQ